MRGRPSTEHSWERPPHHAGVPSRHEFIRQVGFVRVIAAFGLMLYVTVQMFGQASKTPGVSGSGSSSSSLVGTTTWTNSQGGSFDDQGNWSAGVPTITDPAVFSLDTSGYTVLFNGDAFSKDVLIGPDIVTFDLQGFKYTIGQGLTDDLQVGLLGQSRGDLALLDGELFGLGDINVEFGQLDIRADFTLSADGALLLSGTGGLAFELDESQPAASGTALLQLTGSATLDGDMVLDLSPLANPSLGTTFTLISSLQFFDSFGVILTPAFPGSNRLRFLDVTFGSPFASLIESSSPSKIALVGSTTAAATVSELTRDLEFDPPVPGVIGGDSRDAAVADFDGINGNDVIIALDGTPGGFKVLTNDGSGLNFTEGPLIITGNNPSSVAVGDFDGVNGPDAVIANAGSNTVSIFLNDAIGGFFPASVIDVGANPTAVAVGDVTNNGFPDILVANYDHDTISILGNDGFGSFTIIGTIIAGDGPRALALADFTAGSQLDLAVANALDNTVQIFRNTGSNLVLETTVAVRGSPGLLDPEDLDNDKDTDIVVVNESTGRITILRNEGGAVLTMSSTSFPVGAMPSSIDVADLDGDGDPDLAVVLGDGASRVLRIYRNDTASASSTAPLVFAVDSDMASDNDMFLGIIADLDGDGRKDLVTISAAPVPPLGGLQVPTGVSANISYLLNISGPTCPTDSDGSGTVNVLDLLDMLASWGPCPAPCPEDNDDSGTVNITDLLALLAAWGPCP